MPRGHDRKSGLVPTDPGPLRGPASPRIAVSQHRRRAAKMKRQSGDHERGRDAEASTSARDMGSILLATLMRLTSRRCR